MKLEDAKRRKGEIGLPAAVSTCHLLMSVPLNSLSARRFGCLLGQWCCRAVSTAKSSPLEHAIQCQSVLQPIYSLPRRLESCSAICKMKFVLRLMHNFATELNFIERGWRSDDIRYPCFRLTSNRVVPMFYTLTCDGELLDERGEPAILAEVDSSLVRVPYLTPYVLSFAMPHGDVIGLKVQCSCHCWSENFDPAVHAPKPLIFMDGNRPRVFNSQRYNSSYGLADLLASLSACSLYWTPSDRNYGVYNATTIIEGKAYTAFFTLRKERNRFDGVRYHLVMGVESAYFAPQPSKGMKVRAATAIDAALNNKKLRYKLRFLKHQRGTSLRTTPWISRHSLRVSPIHHPGWTTYYGSGGSLTVDLASL